MKEKLIVYPAVLDNRENSDDVYTVTFPDVPGAISEGKGLAQAMLNGSEALGLMLYDVMKCLRLRILMKSEPNIPKQ